MKLTGKTKEAFLKWLDTDRRMELHLPDVYLNALIIEFFDSVGIYVSIKLSIINFEAYVYDDYIGRYKSRTEATNAAIEKANEMLNKC